MWSQYTPTYTTWYNSLRGDADKIINLPTANQDERAVINVRVKALAEKTAATQETICDTNPLIAWQRHFISSLEKAIVACEESAANVKAFQEQLAVVAAYNDDDQSLAKTLNAIPQTNELKEEVWAKQPAIWGEVTDAIGSLVVSDAFKPTQQRAIEKASALQAAWTGLNTAHQAKDKEKYTAALTALGTSYDALDEIATASETGAIDLAKVLQDRYRKAFQ